MNDGGRVGGIIYLNQKGRQAYLVEGFEDAFKNLCGGRQEFRSKVALVTTHCDDSAAVAKADDVEWIYDKHWKPLIKGGAVMKQWGGSGSIPDKPDQPTLEILKELVQRAREAEKRQQMKLKKANYVRDLSTSLWSRQVKTTSKDSTALSPSRTPYDEMEQHHAAFERLLLIQHKLLSDACARNDEESANRFLRVIQNLHLALAGKYAEIIRRSDAQHTPTLTRQLNKFIKAINDLLQKVI